MLAAVRVMVCMPMFDHVNQVDAFNDINVFVTLDWLLANHV